jgi:hypothetical protein
MTDDEFERKMKKFAKTRRPADYPTETERAEVPKVSQRRAMARIYEKLLKK